MEKYFFNNKNMYFFILSIFMWKLHFWFLKVEEVRIFFTKGIIFLTKLMSVIKYTVELMGQSHKKSWSYKAMECYSRLKLRVATGF
jgi:hypothetical protein